MNGNCRLCLNIVNRKRTTIVQSEFRKMMETVFSFSIVNEEGLPSYVCTGCSSAVRNFFSYSLKVQQNQRHLEKQYRTSNKLTSPKRTTRSRVVNFLEHHTDDDGGGEADFTNMDTDFSSACNIALVQADPLSELSTIDLSSQHIKIKNNTTESIAARYKQLNNVSLNMKQPQTSDLQYSCNECELKLSNKIQLYKHRRVHQKKECPVCNLLFRSDKIKEHFTKKHPDDKPLQADDELRCINCQELFKTGTQLNNHLRLLDQTLIRSPEHYFKSEVIDNKWVDNERVYYCTKRYKCCKCEEKFVDRKQVVKHQRLHRTTECPMCNKILRTDRIKQHIATRHPRHDGTQNVLYKCAECKKLFENASQLTIHRISHKKQVCPVCKETATSSHIKKHLQSFNSIHMSEDSNEFSDGNVEVSETNTKNQSIQCYECGRTFLTKYQLQKHQRTHRKMECPVCRKLLRSHTISTHIALKHPEQRTNVGNEKLLKLELA
ncbi:zinc finger protein 585A-like [Anopheles marshallii]|uniref:zinc finger protein 585A-like n=1 Tax=Anopheles marshallii TaxID=1521116 RepID=UPI00237A5EC9|nr:zinc finger protein 585A-like [Anopheles marshallii]